MKIALLTCKELEGYVAYEEHLDRALEKAGLDFDWIIWSNWKEVDWKNYDAVIVRTTWDYQKHIDDFMQAMKEISNQTKLFNSYETIKWNHSKDYLLEFNQTSTKPVPTTEVKIKSSSDIEQLFGNFNSEKIIIKPFISATAHDTFWLTPDNFNESLDQIIEVNSRKRMMAQPFLSSVVEEGEYSFHFFNGEFSHAILKTPKPGDFRSQEEYGSNVQTISPDESMLVFAQTVLSHLNEKLLYARVDFVRNENEYNLMELELIEPSLYFGYGEGSADRLVHCLKERLK